MKRDDTRIVKLGLAIPSIADDYATFEMAMKTSEDNFKLQLLSVEPIHFLPALLA
jgi:hypothetical protein